MLTKKDFVQTVKVVAIALALTLGVNYLQADYVAPTSGPTSNNAAAPLNVGSASQTKVGNLNIYGNLSTVTFAAGPSIFTGSVQIQKGAAAGNVLTSDANGNAAWKPLPASQQTAGVTSIKAGNWITISPSSGTGDVTINAASQIPGNGTAGQVLEPDPTTGVKWVTQFSNCKVCYEMGKNDCSEGTPGSTSGWQCSQLGGAAGDWTNMSEGHCIRVKFVCQ